MASVGDSVARAREARESMMRLSQSIWTAVRGDSWTAIAPIQAVLTATIFTVSCSSRTQDSQRMGNKRVSECQHTHLGGTGRAVKCCQVLLLCAECQCKRGWAV